MTGPAAYLRKQRTAELIRNEKEKISRQVQLSQRLIGGIIAVAFLHIAMFYGLPAALGLLLSWNPSILVPVAVFTSTAMVFAYFFRWLKKKSMT